MNHTEDFFEIHVGGHLAGMRLDQIMATRVSRRFARRLIEAGAVFVDRVRVKVASRPIRSGSVVRAPFALPEPSPAVDPGTWILHQDPAFLIVNKPAGWATAPTPHGDRSIVTELQKKVGPLWVVSRLDFHTSGVLPLVRDRSRLESFEKLLRSEACEKIYVAMTRRMAFDESMLDGPIGPHPERRQRYSVRRDGRPAITEVLSVEPRSEDRQLVTLRLHTGRTHQIRVHLAQAGAPVIGDPWYPVGQAQSGGPMLLHALRLAWTSPEFGNAVFEVPPPWET